MKHKYLIFSISLFILFSGCSTKDISTETSSYTTPKSNASTDINAYKSYEEIKTDSKNNEIHSKENIPKGKSSNDVTSKDETPSNTNFDLTEREWFFLPNKTHTQPEEPEEILNILKGKDAYYVGKDCDKVLYLTFDEGYENGYSSKILDILKKNNVKAAFFVTEPYIKANKDLINRMVKEGHLVCNHSKTHPSMAKVAKISKSKFDNEILSTEKTFKEVTNQDMPKFFRPPMGAYNELSLDYTKKLGYKTIFWSMAYKDYDTNNQPSSNYAKKIILNRTHNGSIMLLHAVSKTNTEILDYLIHEWEEQGYTFKSLTNLD